MAYQSPLFDHERCDFDPCMGCIKRTQKYLEKKRKEQSGFVGNMQGIVVAHIHKVGETKKHEEDPAKCWC